MRAPVCLLMLMFWALCACSKPQRTMLANDIRLYENTSAWELAKAVDELDTSRVSEICQKKPSLVNYQEPRFGQTLLEWATYTNKYGPVKALVEAGANPDLQSNDGTSAFIHSADIDETTAYLVLLLKHGGDVNAIAVPKDGKNQQQLRTPLIAAARSSLANVKLLVVAGADVNYTNEQHQSALHEACDFNRIEIIRYLIIERQADPRILMLRTINGDSLYLHHLLRNMLFPLDSKEYRVKMEVVDYLKMLGLNYWQTEVPAHLYKNYSQEYLEKY